VYRDFSVPGEQKDVFTGIVDVAKLASIFYPNAAFAAIGVQYVVKPVAEKTSEYATPKFIGAMSQAYGIPEQYLWSWH
jgi:hypothetical protein